VERSAGLRPARPVHPRSGWSRAVGNSTPAAVVPHSSTTP
jgi:hypothetical protein